jgi:hypothetical protein
MRSNDKNETVARFAARGVMLAALLAMMCVGVNGVQAGAAKSSTAAASAAHAPAKGAHEGIGIHGHWTIEVRNPDGTLARHVEFENGLCISQANGNQTTFEGGDQIIATLLAGATSIGGWEILLGSPAIPTGAAASGPACPLQAVYTLEQKNDASATGVNGSGPLCTLATNCFPNLNPPTLNAVLVNVVTLAGQFTVPGPTTNSVTISAVGTSVGNCGGGGSLTAQSCVSQFASYFQFTGAYLTGVAPMPAAITVIGGQSVSVNVQFSFH